MPFRRTKGIITDSASSDPQKEADVIMTAAVLGFSASHVRNGTHVRFDIDPKDRDKDWSAFETLVKRIDRTTIDYLRKRRLEPAGRVNAGCAPDYAKGAVIMGVYLLANQSRPVSVSEPVLSVKGKALYERIKNEVLTQYKGRGAYTGFVDNNNTEGSSDPVGPLSTVRFLTPDPDTIPPDHPTLGGLHPRWLPPAGIPSWSPRLRRGSTDSYAPWGLIGGDDAGKEPDPKVSDIKGDTNLADQITRLMKAAGMVFVGEPAITDIAAYTHGMIHAVYKAYTLGPSCTPYEIAVGTVTTKMASCFPCAMFIDAQGYPPTAIHLGRGESWAPLYEPYNPDGEAEPNELGVIRDLNNSWRAKCAEYVPLGLEMLDDDHIAADHRAARDGLLGYLSVNSSDSTAATLILDALTIHQSESVRVGRTLKQMEQRR